ncbi:unnamed protein product [Paramecium sonneborni]|uniref:Tetratricopeptide repeat protein n=1 Tax=Paramecium sonneborni TaxID=65129 RepID=A0A8S1NT64_9CILI|nr:unnamed protein product [Paramecium sonneborni]
MQFFRCTYLGHENEEIIGFCLNQTCQNATQYCYECLSNTHSDHLNDCIRFAIISKYINQFIQIQREQTKQFKEIQNELTNCFEQIFKKIDQNNKILESMNQKLQNKEFLSFKSQINILKLHYSKEKEKQIQEQITQLNNINSAIKIILRDLIKWYDQIISGNINKTKIEEVNRISQVQNQQRMQEAKRLFIQGQKLVNEGKFKEALIKFDESIKQFNQDYIIYVWKGFALDSLSNFQEAINCYDKAIEINPNHDNAWNNKGWALNCLNKFQEAIYCYDKAIEINPNHDYAWNNKGLALNNLNRYQEAIECLDKAIQIDSQDDYAWNNKGFALRKLNRFQEALECYERANEINPNQDSAWNNKGFALKKMNRFQEAVECYDKAIQINSKNDMAWNNKGSALNNLNRFQEAIESLDQSIQINSKNNFAFENKGFALHQLKEYQKAIECYDLDLSLHVKPVTLKLKADALLELGKKSEAKKLYQTALQKGSNEKDYIKKQLSKL